MENLSFNPEVEPAEPSELRILSIGLQNLLNEFGAYSDEYDVGQTMKFRGSAVEVFKLTADETEFIESEQEITIRTIVKKSRMYKKGIYVEVWTNLGPLEEDEDESDTEYWRLTEYGFLTNNKFYVQDEFQILSNEKAVAKKRRQPIESPDIESVGLSAAERREQIEYIESSLAPKFTKTDYRNLMRVLTEFSPANIISHR